MSQLMFEAYIECLLWTETDPEDSPLDDHYSIDDISQSKLEELRLELEDFIDHLDDLNLLSDLRNAMEDEQIGHDFCLTRNGHGAGFWDRGLGKLGDDVTEACKSFGTIEAYDLV